MSTVTLTPPSYAKLTPGCLSLRRRDPELDRVSETAFAIVTYYIPYNLRNSLPQESLRGLPKSYLIPPKQPPELFTLIAKLCTVMIEDHSSFFEALPERLNLPNDYSKTVFIGLCKQTFTDKKINWGRIVSIFTMAGSFAVYFVKKGQLSLAQKIPLWVQEFVDEDLSDWIIEQGGWDDMYNKLSRKGATTSANWSKTLMLGSVVAAAGYLFLSNGFAK